MSMRTLAETLHISRANAYARVERLRRAGVIRGFRADIDPVAAGMGTSAYVTVNLRQAEWRGVREQLRALPGVVHIALVGGEFDVDPAGAGPRTTPTWAGWCSTRSRAWRAW